MATMQKRKLVLKNVDLRGRQDSGKEPLSSTISTRKRLKTRNARLPDGAKLKHEQVKNLRLTFQTLDTNGTGKILFENFLSGMKGEVKKVFMRAALQRGLTGLMTFSKLLEIIFPHLAHLCREEMPTLTEKHLQKDGEDGSLPSRPLMEPQRLKQKQIKEIQDIFHSIDKHRTGIVSFKDILDIFGGNVLFTDMELVENMQLATKKKIEPKLLVPVSPMSVALSAITTADNDTSSSAGHTQGTINHATVPSAGTTGRGVSEALERVCEGDYEERTERDTSVSLSLMDSPAGSLSFSFHHT